MSAKEHLLMQGLELVLLGMGTVFTFLALLVLLTGLMSRLLARFPETATTEPAAQPAVAGAGAAQQPDLLPVLSAAVKAYRRRRS